MDAALRQACQGAAERTLEWLLAQLHSETGLGDDLAAHYKAPALLQLAGRPREARQLLDRIAARFQQANGDFLSRPELRTADPVLAAYPAYMTGWIAMVAQRIGRFDLSLPAWRWLQNFWLETPGGFCLEPCGTGQGAILELLTCAHLGLAALHFGDLERARGAGRTLQRFLDQQPSPADSFYLRMSPDGQLQTRYPQEARLLHRVAAREPGQAWFFIGYPMAFLCRLHQATGEASALATARGYAAFAEACGPQLVAEPFAHKVAWGCAELAALTGAAAPQALSTAIVQQLLQSQNADGSWLAEAPFNTRIDQSVEIAIWLLEARALV